ncbi:MAG: mannose-1-phosphate guanylyltransferase [Spirochaetaceae bacterium]
MMVDNVVVLAGGSGTRLWPASLRSRPKQFLDPGTGSSLLRMTVERAAAVTEKGRIIIVTHKDQVAPLIEELSLLETLRGRLLILPEPAMRNTAPAITLAVTYLALNDAAEGTTLVLAADHIITPVDKFAEACGRADALARTGKLVTFGITPTRAETGYGYIEAGEGIGPGSESGGRPPGRRVTAFREKPDEATARAYLEAGNFLWNSGMFVFRNDSYLEALNKHRPEVATGFEAIQLLETHERQDKLPVESRNGVEVAWDGSYLAELYGELPKVSIDYAVMEKAAADGGVAVVEPEFEWNDVGSWDEMAELAEAGVLGGAKAGSTGADLYTAGASNVYAFSDLPVAVCGVDDLSVIVKNGKVLVVKRGKSQLVRQIVEKLEAKGREELL